jgi:hypothetical protein
MKGKLYIVPKPEPPRPGCGTSLLANLKFELQWLARGKAKVPGKIEFWDEVPTMERG